MFLNVTSLNICLTSSSIKISSLIANTAFDLASQQRLPSSLLLNPDSLLWKHMTSSTLSFYIKKGLDSVPHQVLLNTLCSLNLPFHLLCWLRSYLTIRTQQVAISAYLSTPCHALSGVLLGSILGPFLFFILMIIIFSLWASSISFYYSHSLCRQHSSFPFGVLCFFSYVLSSLISTQYHLGSPPSFSLLTQAKVNNNYDYCS